MSTLLREQLRSIREALGVSQSALGARLGMPQSHVSAIESGKVDPRLSSFLEMARVLDQELILVPRKMLPAVRGLMTGDSDAPLWQSDEDAP